MPRPEWVTVPNVITLFRLALVPVFVVEHLLGHPSTALICFAVAAVSDVFDGLAARLLNQRSKLGALLDPVADKVLVFCALVTLMVERRIPWWLLGLVIFRDGFIIVGALVVRQKHLDLPAKPSRIGKYATFSLVLLVVMGLADQIIASDGLLHAYTNVVAFLAGFAVLVSTIQYFARFGYLFFAPAREAS